MITGATGGIGAELALSYASTGRTLILHGRNRARLEALSRCCEVRGARVITAVFDLREHHAAVQEFRRISNHEPIDLVIVNAGVTRTIGAGEEAESLDTAREVLAVNLDGALATVAGVLPDMRRRGSGQIAFMSSLAAYYGLAQTPTYCATKAALRAYAEALRSWLAPEGIAVSVVLPGFVDTAMTAGLSGPKPAALSAQRAALLIRRGLERNRARIAFPRRLAWGLLWLSLLPSPIAERILSVLGFNAPTGGRSA